MNEKNTPVWSVFLRRKKPEQKVPAVNTCCVVLQGILDDLFIIEHGKEAENGVKACIENHYDDHRGQHFCTEEKPAGAYRKVAMKQTKNQRDAEIEHLLGCDSFDKILLCIAQLAQDSVIRLFIFTLIHLFKVQNASGCNEECQAKEADNEHDHAHTEFLVG